MAIAAILHIYCRCLYPDNDMAMRHIAGRLDGLSISQQGSTTQPGNSTNTSTTTSSAANTLDNNIILAGTSSSGVSTPHRTTRRSVSAALLQTPSNSAGRDATGLSRGGSNSRHRLSIATASPSRSLSAAFEEGEVSVAVKEREVYDQSDTTSLNSPSPRRLSRNLRGKNSIVT